MKTNLSFWRLKDLRIVILICGSINVLLGSVVLIGWALNNDALKAVFPGLVTMKANTALGLALCGGALVQLARGRVEATNVFGGFVLALVAATLGALTLGEYLFNWDLGIDQVMFRDVFVSVGTWGPGRMAPSSAFFFVLTGGALAIASQRTKPKIRFPILSAIGTTLVVVGVTGTLGQMSKVLLNFDFWNFSGMAIHTALGFGLLGGGLLVLVKSESGFSWALDETTTLGFIIAIALMLSVAGISWNYTYKLTEAGALVGRSNEVLKEIENIRAAMAELESGQRAYIITGDERVLKQREQILGSAHEDLNELLHLAGEDPQRRAALHDLGLLMAQRTDFGELTIAARRDQGFFAAQDLLEMGTGVALTKKIDDRTNALREQEYAELLTRQKQADITATATFLLLPLGIFLSLTILSLALFFLNQGIGEQTRTEAKLRTSLREITDLKAALDVHAIVATTDPQGRITSVNDKFCAISKFSRDELLGQDLWVNHSGDQSQEFVNQLRATIERGKVWQGEIKNRAKDDSSYWVDTTIVPFLNGHGKPRQYVAIRADITERKIAEEASARLAAIVDSSTDAIIGKNLDGIVTSWNRGAQGLFGYSADEMIGRSIARLIPPDRQKEELEILNKIKRGVTIEHFETKRVTREGRLIDVSVTVSPIMDKTGTIIGASKVARDITERKLEQEALRESEKQFRNMIDSIPQLAWMAKADGFIFWYNQRWHDYTGTTPEQMEGWGWKDVHHPSYLPQVLENWTASIASGEPFEMEFPLRAADGTFGWFLTRIVPIKDGLGNVVRWFGTNTDLSQNRETAQKIRELNISLEKRVAERTADLEAACKELEAFSYSVSHDLRAPLRAVDGFSQAVLEDYAPQLPEEGRHYLETIRSSAQRMGRLIDDLLSFSRLSRASMRKQEIKTSKLVQNVLEELRPLRNGRKIDIQVADLPHCHGDPSLLNQVWVNLLSNAVKYTAQCPAAEIEIGSKSEGEKTVYFVRDNGAGFDMRYAHKLFGVFQRLHRLDEFEGTGVGLAIVQRIVRRHDGRVWADAAPNKGATFYFTLNERIQS